MGTFVENILGGAAGAVVTVEPDYIVINDGVSHAAVDDISTVAVPEKVLVIYDHDVPTGRPEAADILRRNLTFARRHGCTYIQAKGTGYQYMVNEVVKPGQIIIGGGTHGSIFGAKGALGINVSIPELARVTETGRYSIVVPDTVHVSLKGTLKEGVSIMDAALSFLKQKTGLERLAVEFYCPTLDDHQKQVLCSMACITGAYTAAIAEEETAGAFVMDLGEVKPMVMKPCKTPKEQKNAVICERQEVAGLELNAGQIGGYTGGTIEELRRGAALLEGKKLAWGFRLTVCPATSRDYIQAMEEGLITRFIDYGAQISAAGDHSVVVQGPGAMGPGERLITTGLHTYGGAMGCEDAEVYTASVESVIAASARKMI
ncbi:MAG: aconitase family protein [Enterocloster aldenensis]